MFRTFMAVQVLVPLILVTLCPRNQYANGVIHGVLGAQAGLVGFWIAFATPRLLLRLLGALPVIVWFMFVLMSRPHYNGWYVLILAFQLAVSVAVLLATRQSARCVVSRAEIHEERLPWQFRLKHLLMLMVAVPVLWGVVPWLETLPFLAGWNIFMYTSLLLMAAGFAAGPLIACWAVYGRGSLRWRVSSTILATGLVAGLMAYTNYTMTSSYVPYGRVINAAYWALWTVTSAGFAAVSFVWLKHLGFRLGPQTVCLT